LTRILSTLLVTLLMGLGFTGRAVTARDSQIQQIYNGIGVHSGDRETLIGYAFLASEDNSAGTRTVMANLFATAHPNTDDPFKANPSPNPSIDDPYVPVRYAAPSAQFVLPSQLITPQTESRRQIKVAGRLNWEAGVYVLQVNLGQ